MKIEKLVAEVRRLAAEKPGFVYRGIPSDVPGESAKCYYLASTPGSPGACLFGQALTNIGIPDEVLGRYEDNAIPSVLHGLVGEGYITYGADGDWQVHSWCAIVQSKQDTGLPWAEAVAIGDATHPIAY